MAFTDQYWLSRDAGLIQRVQMAMVKSAISIANEDPATEHHQERAQWAAQVLRDPQHYAERMAVGVAANPAVSAGSSDSDIEFTINSVWNAYAGVITAPAEQEVSDGGA